MRGLDQPSVDEMRQLLNKRAILRGDIRVTELEIKQAEIPIRKSNPRKPELRDEATLDLQWKLVDLERELERVEAEIEYMHFYMNIWKTAYYNTNKGLS